MLVRKPAHSVTIKDIAAHLDMSHSTVSRALNDRSHISEETKERVRQAAKKLGYVANLSARMIRGDAGVLIGLVVPDVQNDFYSSLSKAMAERCRRAGLRMLLAITDDDPETEKDEIRALIEARVSGIVATLTSRPDPSIVSLMESTSVVQMVRLVPGMQTTAVCMNDVTGCQNAAQHLISLGHTRIAYVGTSRTISTGEDRVRGFIQAHEEAGLAVMEDGIELVPPRQVHGFDGMSRLLSLRTRPTAVVIGSSELTIGGLGAIREAGLRIPYDISVIGYGDPVWLDLLSPPLTALSLPVDALAELAMDQLFALIDPEREERPAASRVTRIPPKLILRGSTAPPASV